MENNIQTSDYSCPDNPEIMVSVLCITYNHAKFIREALDGFVMQRTNFPFEVIIHDDCSTDGTDEIVREYAAKYPHLLRPLYETENQYSKKLGSITMRFCLPLARGKYIAFCEGDDYWTDPLKLQKQVDFLESHPDYSMVHTNFQGVDAENHHINNDYFDHWRKKSLDESRPAILRLLENNYILTLTTCMRREVLDNPIYKKCPVFMDYSLFLAAALMGDIKYLPEVMGCYRKHPGGLTSSNDSLVNHNCEVIKNYYESEFKDGHYTLPNSDYNKRLRFYAFYDALKQDGLKYAVLNKPAFRKSLWWMLPKVPIQVLVNHYRMRARIHK